MGFIGWGRAFHRTKLCVPVPEIFRRLYLFIRVTIDVVVDHHVAHIHLYLKLDYLARRLRDIYFVLYHRAWRDS